MMAYNYCREDEERVIEAASYPWLGGGDEERDIEAASYPQLESKLTGLLFVRFEHLFMLGSV